MYILNVTLQKKRRKQMKKPIVWIFALTMTVCATLVLSLSCISFSLQNTALKNEVGDLNNKNSELNKQVQDLNNVIGDLQETVDFFEDQVALITYEVDGQVWKIDVAQVGEKIELPVAPDTATEIFNGWKVEGDDKVYAGTYEATAGVKFVADMFNPTEAKASWQPMEWNGQTNFQGYHVWTDGVDQYLGLDYRLNKATNTWESITMNWEGEALNHVEVKYIWTDGVNCYLSMGNSQYVLDRETLTWKIMEWNLNGFDLNIFYGDRVFNYQGKTYFAYNTGSQYFYVLDVATQTWENMNWTFDPYSNYWLDGDKVFILGDTCYVYRSYYARVDFENKKLVPVQFSGIDYSMQADCFWTDGKNCYFTYYGKNYFINKGSLNLTEITWDVEGVEYGNCIWTDGTNLYHSDGSNQYVFVKA